jgi:hypothetical protein
MDWKPGRAGTYAATLLLVCAGLTVVTGRPLLFPSLGPTAYVLATAPNGVDTTARRVVGGHAIGVVAGVVAFHLLAPGLSLTGAVVPLSESALGLAGAGVVSVGLTTAGMVALDARHAPACATTLIVSLGLLTTPAELGGIVAAVVVLYTSHRLVVYGLR